MSFRKSWLPIFILLLALFVSSFTDSSPRADAQIITTLPPLFVLDWNFENSDPLAGWTGDVAQIPLGEDPTTRAACTWLDEATFLPKGDLVTADRVRQIDNKPLARLGGDYWQTPIYDLGISGRCRLDTFNRSQLVGIELFSPEFTIGNDYISYLVGGGGSTRTYVDVQVKIGSSWTTIDTNYGSGHFAMERVNVNVAAYDGDKARLRVVDDYPYWLFASEEGQRNTPRGFIIRDREECLDDHPSRNPQTQTFLDCLHDTEAALVANNESTYGDGNPWIAIDHVRSQDTPIADAPTPVWGMADLHAHLLTEFGLAGIYPGNFDGLIFRGIDPDSLDVEAQCEETKHEVITDLTKAGYWITAPANLCTGMTLGNFCTSNPSVDTHSAINGSLKDRSDEIFCRDRLKFKDGTPQKIHEDMLYRAWEGGLRLTVVDVLNNTVLPRAADCNVPLLCDEARDGLHVRRPVRDIESDEVTMTVQINRIKLWAALNTEWVGVAYNSAEARDLIRDGKLAIVFGSEVDNIAHEAIMSEALTRGWVSDINDYGALLDELRPGDADAEAKAEILRTALGTYLDELDVLGVRHIFPIHLMDNAFGGMALYDRKFHLQSAYQNGVYSEVRDGWDDNIRYRIDYDKGFTSWFLEGVLWGSGGGPSSEIPASHRGHANAWGLSPLGEVMIEELMKRGMLIDIDHMSELAKDRTLTMAEAQSYPIMSSHTGFRELNFGWNQSTVYNGENDSVETLYGTSNEHRLTSERSLSPEQAERIAALGGVIGVGVSSDANQAQFGPIPNDCDGTSKSYFQSYFYAVEKLQGRGIAFGTDVELLGLAGLPKSRFGTEACAGAHGDSSEGIGSDGEDDVRSLLTRSQQLVQRNGVRYESRIVAPYSSRATDMDTGWNGSERQLWEGALRYAADVHRDNFEIDSFEEHDRNRIRGFAEGLAIAAAGGPQPSCCGVFGEGRHEQAGWRAYMGSPAGSDSLWQEGERVWAQYQEMLAGNASAPLHRAIMGGRDFDINIDGMEHYGLLPDFAQDMANVVETHAGRDATFDHALAPLMQSAEHFITMWELAETRGSEISASAPTAVTTANSMAETSKPYQTNTTIMVAILLLLMTALLSIKAYFKR